MAERERTWSVNWSEIARRAFEAECERLEALERKLDEAHKRGEG